MATPRRRSARLSRKSGTPERSPIRKTGRTQLQLASLLERDETPETGAQPTIDQIIATPNEQPERTVKERLAQLSTIKTPTTIPRPAHAELHPKSHHQSTAKAPDSGLKLGFMDISSNPHRSLAIVQNSPSKSDSRQSLPQSLISPDFEFKFASESTLSNEAQKLMDNVREEAARIKAQMVAEKDEQDRKDGEAEQLFGGVNATGRKIAKPKGKAGRFSDVHMAQFKKMDSIANHPSSFRAKPGFAQPTQQSLKRSGSKAGLDDLERPKTAGKGTPGRPPPPFVRQQSSASPFKSILVKSNSDRLESASPAKRMRQSDCVESSKVKPVYPQQQVYPWDRPTVPEAKSSHPASVLIPTKASLARSKSFQVAPISSDKISALPRSNSFRSLKHAFEAARSEPMRQTPSSGPVSSSKLPLTSNMLSGRPLPPVPVTTVAPSTSKSSSNPDRPIKPIPATLKVGGLTSRLPTFAGLKSILRSTRKSSNKAPVSKSEVAHVGGTDKQGTSTATGPESTKKVDFTPSTKSRYAVKLAAGTPSPSKIPRVVTPGQPSSSFDLYDPAAYIIHDENGDDDEDNDWEDADDEVHYPVLDPPSSSVERPIPVIQTFAAKAKEHNRRESAEFKSIFTTLEHPSRSDKPTASALTQVNTKVNRTNPIINAKNAADSPSKTASISKHSPSTIRRVRSSGIGVGKIVEPFEDTINTLPHGLPGKKRRRESTISDDLQGHDDDAKENRKLSVMPSVPGGWEDTILEEVHADEVDEGDKRGGKRMRLTTEPENHMQQKALATGNAKKKVNAAREAAAKNAKDRKDKEPGKAKAKGILSLSRLNMLARPKERK